MALEFSLSFHDCLFLHKCYIKVCLLFVFKVFLDMHCEARPSYLRLLMQTCTTCGLPLLWINYRTLIYLSRTTIITNSVTAMKIVTILIAAATVIVVV